MSKAKRVKEQARRKSKQLRKVQELAERAQVQEEELEEEIPLEVELDPEEEEIEPEGDEDGLQKDYAEPMMENSMMMIGPTSFEELDAMEQARETAEQVYDVTWSTNDLVRNILNHPMLKPAEKATKIKEVASGFEERVTEVMAEDMEKDLDVLQIEAILATEARHNTLLQKGMEYVDLIKKKLTGKARKKLSSEQFALPSKKKYPIHDKAHVRNALARAAQQIKAGGEGAADAKAALPKIRAAAKRMGIEMEKSTIMIEKDAKGDWRWIGSPTNNFIDRQGDVLAKSAHKKYVAWLDANPDMAPVFICWHIAGTEREHPVDFWMEKEGAVIMSGILTEDEVRGLFSVQKEKDLGMSFQGVGLRLDKDPRVITDYWMYEVSDLPLDRAANPFTNLETMTKEVGMDKLEYLTKIMGSEEKAKAYLEKTSQKQKELQAAGIMSKAKDDDKQDETPPPAETQPKPMDVTAILEAVAKEYDIEGLNAFVAQAQEDHEKLDVLEELVKQLQGGMEDQLAQALTPPVARFAWSQAHRASQSPKTKLNKGKPDPNGDGEEDDEVDEQLSKALPGVSSDYWLSQLTGMEPISQSEVQS